MPGILKKKSGESDTETFERLARGEDREPREREPRVSHDDGETTVELPDDDDDDAEEAPAERPSRADRRHNRYRELEQSTQRLQQENQELMRRLALQQQPAPPPPPQQPATPPPDPHAEREQLLDQREALLQDQWAALSQKDQLAQRQEFLAKLAAVRKDREAIIRARAEENILKQLRPQGQQQGPQLSEQQQFVRNYIIAKYPDVVGHPQAKEWAIVRHRQRLLEGTPDTEDELHNTMEEARKKYGMPSSSRQASAPTANERARFTGSGRGPTGGPGSGSGPRTVKMDKQMRRMATSAFPSLPEEKAIAKWAKEVGANLDSE